MMSVARYLTETHWPGAVFLILGFAAPRDFIFRDEIATLASRNPNLSVIAAMSRPGDEPWSGPSPNFNLLPAKCLILLEAVQICSHKLFLMAIDTTHLQ
jgi:NAD(P)H-flavin reductase